MVAGIMWPPPLTEVLTAPSIHAHPASAWMILGGPALFLAGHAAFKYVLSRDLRSTRLAGMGRSRCSPWRSRRCRRSPWPRAAAVVAMVAAADRRRLRPAQPAAGGRASSAGGRRLDQVQAPTIVLAV